MTRSRWWVVAGLMLMVAGAAPRDVGAQRLNPMIALLEAGETVFGPIWGDKSPNGAVAVSRNNELDYIFYDMEHAPFDIPEMRTFMQFLLDPGRILRRGQPGWERTVLVRIPAYGRELNQWMIKNILDQGAHGIITPHIETAEQALALAEQALPGRQQQGSARAERPDLTGRELEVLQLAANGRTNKEIGADLRISPHTVQKHFTSLFLKLGTSSRSEACARAIREGLID